ncbi:LytR/AlgR family response regulator transcription factor [Marinifilum flexuosum]|uniref:LytR/AlgR family response regulator transcription factor n=1 Tax=Marinifilum flexuosum TaxID=1117708 RepID=UPI002492C235|nr:response regulator transcription factor [Marinifilum flexuosum]
MKCIAIDDEPFALDLVKDYIEKTPFLDCIGAFSNPLKALGFLMENKVDLLFLDINMPEITGIQFLNSLKHKPKVIFTTAYSEYGVESYDYDAIDYLLKPIKYERFLRAVGKAFELNKNILQDSMRVQTNQEEQEQVLIRSGSQIHKVSLEDICFIEGAGNYVNFHTSNKKIMALQTMKETIDQLPSAYFARVHKSYVVSMKHIDMVERHQITIQGHKIPIGITYREQFLNRYKSV